MPRRLTAILASGLTLAASGFAGGLASGFASGFALAASPPPGLSWTGFYVGGNLGLGLGWPNSETTVTGLGVSRFDFTHPDSLSLDGILGGAEIGYSWQASPNWVYGLEADWQGTSIDANKTYSDAYSGTGGRLGVIATGTGTTTYDASIPWFGTARGRLGYAFDRWLVYGTGGLAYGQVRLNGSLVDSGTTTVPHNPPTPFSTSAPFSASRVNAGWTLGAGVEGALVDHWTWKAEYLYVDLGSLNASGANAPITVSEHARFADNILRVGVDYRFGN